jgi:hypothetical protein
MSANLECTAAYQYLVQCGHTFQPHKAIAGKLRFTRHANGDLLAIHYAIEDGNWSKHKRDRQIEVAGDSYLVNELIICGALDLFGDDQFVWLANNVNAGEKMHRRAGVKMHHGHSQVSATANAAFQFDQRACFPVPTWRLPATARSVGDGRSGATRSSASMASTGPSPQRAPWHAERRSV